MLCISLDNLFSSMLFCVTVTCCASAPATADRSVTLCESVPLQLIARSHCVRVSRCSWSLGHTVWECSHAMRVRQAQLVILFLKCRRLMNLPTHSWWTDQHTVDELTNTRLMNWPTHGWWTDQVYKSSWKLLPSHHIPIVFHITYV